MFVNCRQQTFHCMRKKVNNLASAYSTENSKFVAWIAETAEPGGLGGFSPPNDFQEIVFSFPTNFVL